MSFCAHTGALNSKHNRQPWHAGAISTYSVSFSTCTGAPSVTSAGVKPRNVLSLLFLQKQKVQTSDSRTQRET